MTLDYRHAWLFVVILSVASASASAQRLACAPIRAGETAASVARRISGDARNRQEQWFQIFDPATGRVVPKAQYAVVRPGWSACIVNDGPRSSWTGLRLTDRIIAAFAFSSRTLG